MKDTFTVADIARILKVSETPIYKDIEKGRLKAHKGTRWEITFKDATDYINAIVQERHKK